MAEVAGIFSTVSFRVDGQSFAAVTSSIDKVKKDFADLNAESAKFDASLSKFKSFSLNKKTTTTETTGTTKTPSSGVDKDLSPPISPMLSTPGIRSLSGSLGKFLKFGSIAGAAFLAAKSLAKFSEAQQKIINNSLVTSSMLSLQAGSVIGLSEAYKTLGFNSDAYLGSVKTINSFGAGLATGHLNKGELIALGVAGVGGGAVSDLMRGNLPALTTAVGSRFEQLNKGGFRDKDKAQALIQAGFGPIIKAFEQDQLTEKNLGRSPKQVQKIYNSLALRNTAAMATFSKNIAEVGFIMGGLGSILTGFGVVLVNMIADPIKALLHPIDSVKAGYKDLIDAMAPVTKGFNELAESVYKEAKSIGKSTIKTVEDLIHHPMKTLLPVETSFDKRKVESLKSEVNFSKPQPSNVEIHIHGATDPSKTANMISDILHRQYNTAAIANPVLGN